MSDTAIRELDWYLRDHLFRESKVAKTTFKLESLPSQMSSLYLRYKNANLEQLSQLMVPVINNLLARNVLEQQYDELSMPHSLTRLQCSKCFYINYLAKIEQRACLRCQHTVLHDFPKKKA